MQSRYIRAGSGSGRERRRVDQSGSYSFQGQDLAGDAASALLRELAAPPVARLGSAPVDVEADSYRASGWLELVVIGSIYFASIGLAVWQVADLSGSPALAAPAQHGNGQ
jgi:hypothetical protein